MSMKKLYNSPELQVIIEKVPDVIMASPTGENGDDIGSFRSSWIVGGGL